MIQSLEYTPSSPLIYIVLFLFFESVLILIEVSFKSSKVNDCVTSGHGVASCNIGASRIFQRTLKRVLPEKNSHKLISKMMLETLKKTLEIAHKLYKCTDNDD